MNQAHNGASRRIEMLRAFDTCFSGRVAKRPQLQAPPSADERDEIAAGAGPDSKVIAAPPRAPAKPKVAPKPAAIEPYMLSERAYLLEFGH